MLNIPGLPIGLSILVSGIAPTPAISEYTYNAGDAFTGTFERGSIGTQRTGGVGGLLETVSSDVLRDNHYVWHPGEGAWIRTTLIEPQRSNVIANTTDLSLPEWSATGATQVGNQSGAPDGTSTYAFLRESSTNTTHFQTRNVDYVGGSKYSYSGWFKKTVVGGRNVRIAFTGNAGSQWVTGSLPQVFINLTTGAVVSNSGFDTPRIEDWGDSWRICVTTTSATVASPSGNPWSWNIVICNGTTTSYLGDGASGFSWWGPQIEAGYPTSYKPVPSSLAGDQTRAADVMTINDPGITGAWTQVETYYDLASGLWTTSTTPGAGAAAISLTPGRAYRSIVRTAN